MSCLTTTEWAGIYSAYLIFSIQCSFHLTKKGACVIVLSWQDKNRHTEGSALCAITKTQCQADGWQSPALGPADNLKPGRLSVNCDRPLSLLPRNRMLNYVTLSKRRWDILAGKKKKRRQSWGLSKDLIRQLYYKCSTLDGNSLHLTINAHMHTCTPTHVSVELMIFSALLFCQ